MITARPALDRLERDGRVLLLFERRVVELSALGLRAWELAATPLTAEVLTDALVAEFGAPEGSAETSVQLLVCELIALGLLES